MRVRVDKGVEIEGMHGLLYGRTFTATLTGTYTLPAGIPPLVFLNPGGAARNVLMPPVEDGLIMLIVNIATAAEAITLQSSAGGALVPPVDILQNEAVVMVSQGTAWRALVGANT